MVLFPPENRLKSHFTLIEMIVVMVVLALIMTIGVVKMAHVPASVEIDNCAQELKSMLTTARMRATAKNCKTYLLYDENNRRFRVSESGGQSDSTASGIEERYLTYSLPNGVEFSRISEDEKEVEESGKENPLPKMPDFSISDKPSEENLGDESVVYSFSAGGTGFGSDFKLELSGHRRLVSCSRLTGIIRVRDPEKEEASD